MIYSRAANLTAGADNTLLEVPRGYVATILALYVTNLGGNTKTFSGRIVFPDDVEVPFLANHSLQANGFMQIEGNFALEAFGKHIVTPVADSTMAAFITFDLFPVPARYTFGGPV